MKIQIALDDLSLNDAVNLMKKTGGCVDIIEVGTPMIMQYGMSAVRRIKQEFPDKQILADMKIMDAGYYEAEIALKAGADYVTVLGTTDDLTIKGCVEVASKYHGKTVVDMICVRGIEKRIRQVEMLGADYVSVHVGLDEQAAGMTPLDQLAVMMRTAQKAQVSVAGGISLKTLPDYISLKPSVIIIGAGITHAENVVETAEAFSRAVHSAC